MRVIFLDFDGTLNSQALSLSDPDDNWPKIDPSPVAALNRVTQATNAKLVIISSWRLYHSVQELDDLLGSQGVEASVIDKTPSMPDKDRRLEIMSWLFSRGVIRGDVTGYVVLDDRTDSDTLDGRFVQPTSFMGFTNDLVPKAIAALQRPI